MLGVRVRSRVGIRVIGFVRVWGSRQRKGEAEGEGKVRVTRQAASVLAVQNEMDEKITL